MKRLFLCSLLVVALCVPLFSASSTSMPSFWRYAHPDAKALVGIEWNRILNSSIGVELREKIYTSGGQGEEALELIDQVQRVFITSPGRPDGAAPDANPPGVLAAQGTFDLDGIRELLVKEAASSRNYSGIEVLEHVDEKGEQVAVALVSPQLVLAGDIPSVEGAIDHYMSADPGLASNPLFQRASQLSRTNDIWMIIEASPSDFGQISAGGQAQFLQDMERLEAGISLQSGLGIQLNLGTKSPQSATEMAAGLQMILGMLLASQQQEPGSPNLAEKLQVAAEGDLVRLALHLDEDELKQTFGQVASSMSQGFGGAEVASEGAGTEASQTEAAPQYPEWTRPAVHQEPVQTGPKVIKIWGLEEGPKEIDMKE